MDNTLATTLDDTRQQDNDRQQQMMTVMAG
jgi:hypothetical protein